uniref:Putative secreted protein n=1 Tax=Anopheles darlingi TaxID=43151 RepID=A0A2M4DJT5_ANODA
MTVASWTSRCTSACLVAPITAPMILTPVRASVTDTGRDWTVRRPFAVLTVVRMESARMDGAVATMVGPEAYAIS